MTMKIVGFSLEFHVNIGDFVKLKAVENTGKCSTNARPYPSMDLLRGAGSAAAGFLELAARPCSHISSLATSANFCRHRINLKKHDGSNSNLGAVDSGERESWCLNIQLNPRRQWEKSQNTFGSTRSRFRASRRNNSRNGPASESLPVRSCAAVADEGNSADEEEDQESQFEGGLYRPFADFAVRELGRRSNVSPLLLKNDFRNMVARDGSTAVENKAFASSKIRYFRSTYINAGPSMQVLNVAGFSRPDYDIPIFCADFFSTATRNIIVLDLNPLYPTSTNRLYKQRYYDDLMAIANNHAKVLPWGDKVTAESMQFFSPVVLWTKAQGQDLHQTLYPAFQDYLLAWLNILDDARPSEDPLAVAKNQEAQHRYLTWRTTKDPGRALLARLYGDELAERYIEEYLFQGVKTLGSKSFLDYFPEYRTEDNTISTQRSMIGKSFSTRPWDENGNFCPR